MDQYKAIVNDLFTKEFDAVELQNLDLLHLGGSRYHLLYKGKSYRIELKSQNGKTYKVEMNGETYDIQIEDKWNRLIHSMGLDKVIEVKETVVKAPMPGLIKKILVAPGQEVTSGDVLLIVEAMKMENLIKASSDQVIKSIEIKQGATVNKNDILIEFE